MLAKGHCDNVEAVNSDFLTISPEDEKYSGITHMRVQFLPLGDILRPDFLCLACLTLHAVVRE